MLSSIGSLSKYKYPSPEIFFKVYNLQATDKFPLLIYSAPFPVDPDYFINKNSIMEGIQWDYGNCLTALFKEKKKNNGVYVYMCVY